MHRLRNLLARALAAGVFVGVLAQAGATSAADGEEPGSEARTEAGEESASEASAAGEESASEAGAGAEEEPRQASPEQLEAAEEERAVGEPTISLEDMPEIPEPTAGVEEITVTATRREESLQDVPVSMTALDSSFVQETGLTQFNEIQKFVPNLTIVGGTDTRSTSLRIRGIGSTGANAGIDPSVGLFIDGIYQGRAGMSMSDLLDIERIEVLRGPQGTLYGKNTAAGLVHVITKRPSYEYEVFAEGIFASYNTLEGRSSVNIPIVEDRVATRLALYRALRGGWDENIFSGDNVNDANKWGLRNQWLFDLSEDVSLLIAGDYAHEKTDCCVPDILTYEGDSLLWFDGLSPPREELNPNFETLDGFDNGDGTFKPRLRNFEPFDGKVDVNVDPKNDVTIWGAQTDWDFALPYDLTLNWLSSYRRYTTDTQFDGDFSQYDAVLAFNEEDLQQASTELRLSSPLGGFIDYTAGFYFYWQDHDVLGQTGYEQDFVDVWFFGPFFGGEPVNNTDEAKYQTYSYAAFGQANLNLGEQFRITGGLRYTHERKTRDGSQISTVKFPEAPPVTGPDIFRDDDRRANNVSGLVNLQFFPTDDVMLFTSFATGFKSGGFNQVRTEQSVPIEFDDETSYNAELGLRSSWFERMLTFNITGYFTAYDDFQALSFTGANIAVRNAGSFFSYGFESDLMVLPLPGLMWRTGVGLNITAYQDFDRAENTVDDIVAEGLEELGLAPLAYSTVCAADPTVARCQISQDLKGERLDNAPRWDLTTSLQYEVPVFDLPFRWTFHTDYSFRSSFFLNQDLDPNVKQDPVSLLDFRTGLRADEGLLDGRVGWELVFWVQNVLDSQYKVAGFDVPIVGGFGAVRGPPRQFGGTVRLWF